MPILPFVQPDLHVEDYWRGIVLFGRNVASYKFALAASLLELEPASGDLVRLEELADPYTRHLRRHLSDADKQSTSPAPGGGRPVNSKTRYVRLTLMVSKLSRG